MQGIKDMLLGIAIILIVIVFHLFYSDSLVTDFIAVIGLIIVIIGYFSKDDKKNM